MCRVLWVEGGQIADPRPRAGALRVEGAFVTGKAAQAPRGAKRIDATGLLLVPAFIDAHVHLSIAGDPRQVARDELRRGIAAVLDLGAPMAALPLELAPLRTRFAGPLLTAPSGYPTQTWGRDGHGRAVSSPEEAREAVRAVAAAGARFAKLAFDGRFPMLRPEVAKAAADEAHALGLRVAAHALEADAVRRALDAGADVLAHTPTEPLPDDLRSRVAGKWIISTLRAFGVDPARLKELHAAGARVAYGTDLGNEGTSPGIDAGELASLAAAGIDPVRAATRDAAELLGLRDLGNLSVGSAASLLAVRSLDPAALASPAWVMIDGKIVA
jgi:imidazolonepropionase-like amidohydrolase